MVIAAKPDPNVSTPAHQYVPPPRPDPHAPTPVVPPRGRARPNFPSIGDVLPIRVGDEDHVIRVVDHLGQGGQGIVVLVDADQSFRDQLGLPAMGVHGSSPFALKIGREVREETERVPMGPPPPRGVAMLRVAGETLVDGNRYEAAVGRWYNRGSLAQEIGKDPERTPNGVRTGLPLDQAANVVSAVLGAADHLHRNGSIHADIKPANILISRLPSGDLTGSLTDFGSAFSTDGPTPDGVATTVGYASERLLKCEGPFGHRDDLHAIGATLAEALSGKVQTLMSGPVVDGGPWRAADVNDRRLLADLQPVVMQTGHIATDQIVARLVSPDARDAGFDALDAMAALYPYMSRGAREPEREAERIHDDATVARIGDRVLSRLDPTDPDRYDPALVPLMVEAAHHLAATSHLPVELRQDLRHAALAAEESCVSGPTNDAAERWMARAEADNAARLHAADGLRRPDRPSCHLQEVHRDHAPPARKPRNPVKLPDQGP